MIDFHTHILPGIDDGSASVTESVSMLREEKRLGIDAVVATPHYYANRNDIDSFLEKRENTWNQLVPYLWNELPDIYLGAEVQYFEGICAVEGLELLRIKGTDLLLVEMPFRQWSSRFVDDVLELNEREGIQVVLAHIERYMDMQSADIWNQLRNHGVQMQCNVTFFDNWRTKFKAMSMLSRGEIQYLGSDCHNMRSRRPNWNLISDKAWNLVENNLQNKKLRQVQPQDISYDLFAMYSSPVND